MVKPGREKHGVARNGHQRKRSRRAIGNGCSFPDYVAGIEGLARTNTDHEKAAAAWMTSRAGVRVRSKDDNEGVSRGELARSLYQNERKIA